MASLAEKERRTDSKAELLHVLSATKQITRYTYDPFGYLVSISYVKENLQNEKITSNMTLTYDEFGNPINPNYQYTYDQTGAWISKTSKTNPADSEKIAYVYKQNKK